MDRDRSTSKKLVEASINFRGRTVPVASYALAFDQVLQSNSWLIAVALLDHCFLRICLTIDRFLTRNVSSGNSIINQDEEEKEKNRPLVNPSRAIFFNLVKKPNSGRKPNGIARAM